MAGDWSLLPMDLLGAIAIKLETIEDFVYFSAVCRSWNCASSSVKHVWKGTPFPWLLLAENKNENPDCIRQIFNLNNNKCYKLKLPETFGARSWGSPYGWIAMVSRDLNIQLFNPITKSKLQFPPCETLPVPPKYFEGTKGGEDYYQWVLLRFLNKLIVIKVSEGDHHDFVIAVLYNCYSLAFARHGDQSWTSVLATRKDEMILLNDLVTMGNYVFGLYNDGAIVYWKIEEFLGQEHATPMKFSPPTPLILEEAPLKGLMSMFLVQSGTNILMVLRYKQEVLNSDGDDADNDIVYLTDFFEVYKLNPTDKSWEETEDVGDVALFVGCNDSMCVSVTSAKCLQPNCIYFTDDECDFWDRPIKMGGHDMGAYDIKSGDISPFYEGDDMRSSFCPAFWFIPSF